MKFHYNIFSFGTWMGFPSCILTNWTSRFPFELTKEYYSTTVCTEHVKYAIENQTKTKIRVHTKFRIVCYKIHCFFFDCNEFVFKKYVCLNNSKKIIFICCIINILIPICVQWANDFVNGIVRISLKWYRHLSSIAIPNALTKSGLVSVDWIKNKIKRLVIHLDVNNKNLRVLLRICVPAL